MTEFIRILGVDPGLRKTGWGIVAASGPRLTWIAHGDIKAPVDAPMSERLAFISRGLGEIVTQYQPERAGIEETFVNQNPRTTLLLGQARGAAMASLSLAGLDVDEFAARKVKQCVVGSGGADKSQIGFMIARLLPKAGAMSEDAADALAVAITTAHHLGPVTQQLRKSAGGGT